MGVFAVFLEFTHVLTMQWFLFSQLLNNQNMPFALKTVIDLIFNAEFIFDIIKIIKISYFLKLKISNSKVSEISEFRF